MSMHAITMNAMTRILCIAMFLLLAMGGSGTVWAQTETLIYDALMRSELAAFYQTPLGLCEDYPEETTTLEIIRSDMELLKRSGVKLLRISFGWDAIESEQDQYDWLFWDEFVRMAVDEYGITLIPYVCYTPLWNATSQEPMEFWRSPPQDYEEFGEFMEDLVNRYKDRIKVWELWNEPDIEWFWLGEQDQFAQLLRAGSEAVRRADPEATIVMGGLAHDTEWLHAFLRDHDVTGLVDVINMHNYYETWQDHSMEEMADYVNRIADIVDRYGGGKPLWMAEVGYSTYRDGARVSEAYSAYYDYEHTPAYQAVDLVRRVTTLLATEKLSAIAWYEIKDLPPASETIGDQQNNSSLGVARPDHTPKPAEQALTFIRRLYAEPMRSLDDETMVARPIDSDAFVHGFEQEDGDVIVVAWLQTRVLGEQGDLDGGMHPDTRQEQVRVTVPRGLHGPAMRYDALGEESPFETLDRDDKAITLDLTLDGGQVYIVQIEKEEAAGR